MGKHKKDTKKVPWDRKKNAIVRNYRKMQKGKSFIPFQGNTGNTIDEIVTNQLNQGKSNDNNAFFQRAMSEYMNKKAIQEERKQIKEVKRKEKEEALRKYAEKKRENFKKLSQKTKWGQPVMRGRMEILLEKIQKSVDDDAVK